MPDFEIVTNYETNEIWTVSDPDGRVIQATAVGELAKIGSDLGAKLAEQTEVLREMTDSIVDLRDNAEKFTPASFPAMQIKSGLIYLPEEQDISPQLAAGIDIYSPSASLADIDKLVALEAWLDQTFGPSISPALKVTYRLPDQTTDKWVVLKDVLPIPTLAAGSVPVTTTGALALNKPFFQVGQTGTLMLVKDAEGETIIVALKTMDEVFSKVSTAEEYQNYIRSLIFKRSTDAVATLNDNNIKNFNYDTIAFTLENSGSTYYAKLPIVSIQDSALAGTTAPAGTILKTEKNEYHYVSVAKTASANAILSKAEIGSSYLIAPDVVTLSSIRSSYGDEITVATQIGSQQALFVNELMQKHTMHFEAASNALKAFVDLMNRVANQV